MPDGPVDAGDPARPAPPRLRLATWNVNSIRSRLDRVVDWLARADIDVLAMQETKCSDTQFPTLPFFELGYEVAHVGFNQWNGVAIASRVGLDDVQIGFAGQPSWSSKPEVAATAEARALGATCAGVRVWSLYVPNGRALADPHYAYKLDWLAALRDTAAGWLRDDPAARSRWSAIGISPPPTTTCGAPNSSPAPRTFPSRNAERSTRSSMRNSLMWYGLSPRGPVSTPTGTTPSCGSRKDKECESTSSWRPRHWPPA